MNVTRWVSVQATLGAAVILCVTFALNADPSGSTTKGTPEKKANADAQTNAARLAKVAEARAQAKLMHNIYAATLETMHQHYFRREQPVLPARALEDVFSEVARHSNVRAGWISVNTRAMSIQHEPKTEFEKNAAKAIAAGKGEWELVEEGVYRRAGAIPLGAGCVSCHTGFFSKTPQTQRFAGLVISVPISAD